MDESLTAFQEKKNNCVGPKIPAKKNSKPRKAPKRPRGQKDIRTALLSVKNELESYSKDFDKVCKKAGIDVDSEQLQIAIALSKSLQDTASTSIHAPETQKLKTQDRIGKIRTTLQEYGFKVPELKIAINTHKVRKHRRNYKLIQISEEEKKEIVANRYTQILFQGITHCSLYCSDVDATNTPLYCLASNVSYETLKTDIFYVNNLIEKSTSTGILLRDWSQIPGRPESPKLCKPMMSMNFSEIECSQEELDIILSGSLKSCKDVVSKKIIHLHTSNNHKKNTEQNVNLQKGRKKEETNSNQDCTLIVDIEDTDPLKPVLASNKHRSSSPDIFDDESEIFDDSKYSSIEKKNNYPELIMTQPNPAIIIMDPNECVSEKSQLRLNLNATNRKSNAMELTECIQTKHNITIVDKLSQLSQKTNTKRRSNDFMELTECVATSSQPFLNKIDLSRIPDIIEENTLLDNIANKDKLALKPSEISNNIDLTESPRKNNKDIEYTNTPLEVNAEKDVQKIDLTQSSNTSDELPFISFPVTNSEPLDDSYDSDKTVILDSNNYVHLDNRSNTNIDAPIDLIQTFEKDNIIQSQSFFDEYSHEHSDSLEELKDKSLDETSNANKENYDTIDLTQPIERQSYINSSKSKSQQNYSQTIESIHVDHSSNSFIDYFPQEATINTYNQCANNSIDDIDLTQNSNTSSDVALSQISEKDDNVDATKKDLTNGNDLRKSRICSNLGKIDNISVDYDELINNTVAEGVISENSKSEPVIHENNKHFSRTNSILSNCSQSSEVFDISDAELDYSIHKSKLETQEGNFAFGGISIMDELSNFGTSKKSIEIDTKTTTTQVEKVSLLSLNRENKQDNERSPIKHRIITEIATPQKACSSKMIMTPKNSEIIIKTNDVTPMVDYESMSTPDIHMELDKYGIKPFKRKRAIQLLMHIYNQTHPIIEASDYLASPPKRRKLNDSPSPKKLIPKQILRNTGNSKNTDTDRGIENIVRQNNKNKGKGKGKSSLRNAKKDVPENLHDDVEMQNEKGTENEVPKLKEIECSPEDWVFQKREKAKVHSCRLPLHIAFHNYLSSRRDLREAILCYQPVEIDLIHKDLVGYGHRYDPKDLLKFLDRRCITVKTTDNDGRNQKR